ncbi:UDP-glucose/GDP-mannose dehydrogenase family protein [Phycisphaeraceae bacterium D3-23]
MDLCIVGTGYVGLVTGVCLAEKGHRVTCVDLDADKVARINRGDPPIFEDGLEPLLQKHIGDRFRATTDLREAVLAAQITMIAVGTPFDGEQIDLSFIRAATQQVGEALREYEGYHLVVIKSTVVPGTTSGFVRPLLAEASGKEHGVGFGVGMNPEFLSEGVAVNDFLEPDRIVLGCDDGQGMALLCELYSPFDAAVPRMETNPGTAEMIKYASNALLATLISYANEVAGLCSKLSGIDAAQVMRGVHLAGGFRMQPPGTDPSSNGRAAPNVAPITAFLEAGCGFGGSCLPKDVSALVAHGQQYGQQMPLLRAVLDINRDRPAEMLRLLRKRFDSLEGRRVAVLGLAFKPGTDDIRLSPALPLIDLIHAQGAYVTLYDPLVTADADPRFGPPARFADSLEDALAGQDAALIVTRWKDFIEIPGLIASNGHAPVVIDGRRMIKPDSVPVYEGIGR